MSVDTTLTITGHPDVFELRNYRVTTSLSTYPTIDLLLRSTSADFGIDALLGVEVSLTLASGVDDPVTWSGVCIAFDVVGVDPTGLSTYAAQIAHPLAWLEHRTNCRIFRNERPIQMAIALLREWRIEPKERVPGASPPALDMRIQYNESDFNFLQRLFEEAGYGYHFEPNGVGMVIAETFDVTPRLALPYAESSELAAARPYASRLQWATATKATHVVTRDYDFERPRFAFEAVAAGADLPGGHPMLEEYEYKPNKALVAAGGGGHGSSTTALEDTARHALARRRAGATTFTFHTNALSVHAGDVVSIEGHPRFDLETDRALLVTHAVAEGTPHQTAHVQVWGVRATKGFRSPPRSHKPRVHGVQSATVVGEGDEPIHTDGLGRVRIHFPWDRQGPRGDASSAWIRVSQAAAGKGSGFAGVPRVGEEVLVAFLDGDPDHPVIVGRVHNTANLAPYDLPEQRAVSGIRSQSTRGAGYNELRFDDLHGLEQVLLRAERDLDTMVRRHRTAEVAGDDTIRVKGNTLVEITGEKRTHVTGDSHARVERSETRRVHGSRTSVVDQADHATVHGDRSSVVAGADVTVAGSQRTTVRHDVLNEVHGSLTAVVGSHGRKRSANLFVEGSIAASASDAIELVAHREIRITCGSSSIRIGKKSIEIVSPKIGLFAKNGRIRLDDGEVNVFGKTSVEIRSEDRVAVTAKGASIGLQEEARIDGTKVLLNSPAQAKDPPPPEPTKPAVVTLVDHDGAPLPHLPFRVVHADGSETSGVLDAEGRAEVAIEEGGHVVFPGLPEVRA